MKQNVAEEGKKATDAVTGLDDAASRAATHVKAKIAEQKSIIKQIEADIASIQKLYDKAAPGKGKVEMRQELAAATRALEEEKNALIGLEASVDKTTQKHAMLRTEVTNAKDEVARLEMAGKRGTAEWDLATTKLARLNDQMRDTNQVARVIADDERKFKSVASGVSGLAGAMSAAVGAASLFGAEQEELAKIQTRLQSVMAITIGLQQVAETLNKDSYFSVVMLSKAKRGWATAQAFLNTQLGVGVGLSRALMLSGVGLLIAGIGSLILLYQNWSKKQEEINRLKKEFADIEKGAIKGMADEKVAAEQLMRVAGDHTKNLDLRKQAVEKLNKLMPDYNGYINREGQLIGNADTALKNYLVSLYKVEKAKKLIAGIEEDTANIDNLKSTGSDPVTFWERMGLGAAKLLTPTNYDEISNKLFQNKSKKWINQMSGIEAGKKQKEDELQKLLGDKNVFTSVFGSPDKSSGGSSSSAPSTKKEYDAQAALAEQLLEIRKRTAALTVDIMQDGLEKRLQQIDLEESEELARIKEHQQKILDEYNKSDAGKANPQTDVKNIPGIDPKTLEDIEAERTKITEAAAEKRRQATEANAKEITDLARKYADEEVKIRYDYQQDIDKLEKAGNTEAANAARMERDKRISEITAEMVESSSLYKLATDEKLLASKEATEALISDTKARIEALVVENKLTRAAADKMIADLDKTQVSRENSKNDNNPFVKLIKGLNDYKKAKKELDDKRKSVTPGELVELEDAANKTLATTAEAAAVSLAGVQEILETVVGALDQLGLLTEEEKQTANEVIGMVGGAADIAMGIVTGNPVQIITGAVNLLANAISLFDKKSKDIAKKQKEHKKNLDDLAHAYTNLQREVDKALGTDVYKKQKEAIANLRKQIAENERLIALERQKKKKKQNQEDIAAWRAEIDALKGEIDDTIQSITEDLAQTNARDLARTLADALVSAARTGEDAFTAMGDVINDVLRNAVVNALSKKFLEKQMDEATEYLAGAMGDGDLSDYEKRRFEEMIRNAGTAFNTALSAYDELFANQDDAARRSASKGIAQASQDSIDELSGTITFMAGEFRTANVLAAARTETGRDMLIITRTILSVLNVIAENTSYNKRLEDIAEGIEKLNRDGVNVKR